MAVIFAVANQKAGCQDHDVQSLGVALAESGSRVLLVDLDPQACLTYSLGFDPDALESSLHDVLIRRTKVDDVIRPVAGIEGSSCCPPPSTWPAPRSTSCRAPGANTCSPGPWRAWPGL